MNIRLTRLYGVVIGALAILGLFVSGHLFQIINTDIIMDFVRVVLAAYLLYVGVGVRSEDSATTALTVVGIVYVVIGLAGLFNPTLGGLLPTGLTGFDVISHLLAGLFAVGAAMRHVDRMHASHA